MSQTMSSNIMSQVDIDPTSTPKTIGVCLQKEGFFKPKDLSRKHKVIVFQKAKTETFGDTHWKYLTLV